MHAAHRYPSETTDTATQHLQSTAPLDLKQWCNTYNS
jgi:hypothetical protein